MNDKVYNVKMSEEVKDRWQNLVTNFAEQNGITKLGDVYPQLIEIIESNTAKINPDFKNLINSVSTNIAAIRSNVLAMNGIYESYQNNAALEKENSEKELVEEIKGLRKENSILEGKIKTLKEETIKGIEEENEKLRNEIKKLEEQLNEKRKFDILLEKLNVKLPEEENDENKQIEGQLSLDDVKQK